MPIIMRFFCRGIVVPTRSFFRQFDIPRSVRKELFFDAPDSRQTLRDMFADVRMLCHDVGLMNPLALWMWRICKIDGRPSRYRGEPQRARPRRTVFRTPRFPAFRHITEASGFDDDIRMQSFAQDHVVT